MNPRFPLVALLAALAARPARAQDASPLGRIFLSEDRRAPSENDLRVLTAALASPDAHLAARAARALGRLERPALAPQLFPLLSHRDGTVRSEAAQAVAQAAQGFRGDSSLEHRGARWPEITAALGARVGVEQDPAVAGMLALSLGRLPYVTEEEVTTARERLLALERTAAADPGAATDAVRGMETQLRASWRRVPLGGALRDRLLALATTPGPEPVRRHALGALLAAQVADSAAIASGFGSTDAESRRLAVTGMARLPGGALRSGLLARALQDPSPYVRLDALRAVARADGPPACDKLVTGAADPAPIVALTALDLMGTCSGNAAAGDLLSAAGNSSEGSWHRSAHALVSLARVQPERARSLLAPAVNAAVWQTRMYAARAAEALRDTMALKRLAMDTVANVREAAIAGLSRVSGHDADAIYRAALTAKDYQLILTAAQALAGTPAKREAALQILAQLPRISAEKRETSRDPRVGMLVRLRETGQPRDSAALQPFLYDFDPAIADSAAAILSGWLGRTVRAAPRRQPPPALTLAEAEALKNQILRITMANGGVMDIELYPDIAPATVARVARAARKGYYDGLTWHRMAANFVLQGGSPGANEYSGDALFMRDELGPLSHERGTLGISTRGRDTGDVQLFINLVDNPRLDYDYTVFGRIVSGLDVMDRILEGDVIRRAEIRPR